MLRILRYFLKLHDTQKFKKNFLFKLTFLKKVSVQSSIDALDASQPACRNSRSGNLSVLVLIIDLVMEGVLRVVKTRLQRSWKKKVLHKDNMLIFLISSENIS